MICAWLRATVAGATAGYATRGRGKATGALHWRGLRPRREDRRRMRPVLQEQRVDENREDRQHRHHDADEFARMTADRGGKPAGAVVQSLDRVGCGYALFFACSVAARRIRAPAR